MTRPSLATLARKALTDGGPRALAALVDSELSELAGHFDHSLSQKVGRCFDEVRIPASELPGFLAALSDPALGQVVYLLRGEARFSAARAALSRKSLGDAALDFLGDARDEPLPPDLAELVASHEARKGESERSVLALANAARAAMSLTSTRRAELAQAFGDGAGRALFLGGGTPLVAFLAEAFEDSISRAPDPHWERQPRGGSEIAAIVANAVEPIRAAGIDALVSLAEKLPDQVAELLREHPELKKGDRRCPALT